MSKVADFGRRARAHKLDVLAVGYWTCIGVVLIAPEPNTAVPLIAGGIAALSARKSVRRLLGLTDAEAIHASNSALVIELSDRVAADRKFVGEGPAITRQVPIKARGRTLLLSVREPA